MYVYPLVLFHGKKTLSLLWGQKVPEWAGDLLEPRSWSERVVVLAQRIQDNPGFCWKIDVPRLAHTSDDDS
jgi:hypothetical protein